MITLLSGNDPYLVSQKRHALQKAFEQAEPTGTVRIIDFEDQRFAKEASKVLEESEGDLFGGRTLFILFQISLLSDAALESFCQELASRADQAEWLLIEPGTLKKTGLLGKLLSALPHQAVIADTPSENQMAGLLRETVESLSKKGVPLSFAPEAERLFLERVGRNTARLFSEVAKVVAFQAEGVITRETVERLLQPTEEDRAFQALDALVNGDRERATVLFREALGSKESVLPLMGLCAWQLRQLLFVREAYDQGHRQSQRVAEVAGISPFVAGKLLRVIERFPVERSKKGLGMLLEYDTAIKQGAMTPEVALDLFLWKL